MMYSEFDINNIINKHHQNKFYYNDKFTES